MDYPQYNPQSPVTPLSAAELQGLDALLQDLGDDGAMSLDGLDGYLTALLLGLPQMLAEAPSAHWLPAVWGGDGPEGSAAAEPFASKRQRKATVVLVLRHLRHISQQLEASPQDWEPIFSIAEKGAEEWADARDWCTGFLQAVDLDPSAWAVDWTDPALAPLLTLGGGLDGEAAVPDDAAVCDELSRAVPEAVLRLLAAR